MTSTQSKSEMPTPAVPFSYAQAAKGLTSTGVSATSSKSPSGNITPAKDASLSSPLTSDMPTSTSWADDAETEPKDSHSSATTAVDAQSSPRVRSPITHSSAFASNGVAGPPSPDCGASSTSTLGREDDTSSIPISSSESTWENKSQSSTLAEKQLEFPEHEPARSKKKNGSKKTDKTADKDEKDKTWFKPLLEAPIPQVNIWAVRAQEAKSKVVTKPNAASQNASAGIETGLQKPAEAAAVTKTKASTEGAPVLNGDSEPKSTERTNIRNQGDEKSSRRETRGNAKASDKAERNQKASPLLSRDESSWPTPDTIKEDDKKPPPQPEKAEKDRGDSTSAAAPKKNAWVAVPFTPTVVFNTPLPSSNPRRGGRAARGAREPGGRGGSSAPAGNGEKGAASHANGEGSRRGRPDPAVRNASPTKTKRSTSHEPAPRKESRLANGVKDASSKDVTAGSDAHTSKAVGPEDELRQHATFQHNTFPRQNNPLKPRQNRRTDLPLPNGEKRRDSENGSKDSEAVPPSPQASIPNQGDGELVLNHFHSPPCLTYVVENGKASIAINEIAGPKYPSMERRIGNFASFSNGTRTEGRNRGRGRGSGNHTFHNGSHQYNNGQLPSIPPYNMPRSPTGYQQDPYFGQQSQHSRVYRGPQNRMSVPSDNYSQLRNGYPASTQLPPINTFVPGSMYDYQGVGSMTAMPSYNPYVETFSLLTMVSHQM
jgi:la-related protein 1